MATTNTHRIDPKGTTTYPYAVAGSHLALSVCLAQLELELACSGLVLEPDGRHAH